MVPVCVGLPMIAGELMQMLIRLSCLRGCCSSSWLPILSLFSLTWLSHRFALTSRRRGVCCCCSLYKLPLHLNKLTQSMGRLAGGRAQFMLVIGEPLGRAAVSGAHCAVAVAAYEGDSHWQLGFAPSQQQRSAGRDVIKLASWLVCLRQRRRRRAEGQSVHVAKWPLSGAKRSFCGSGDARDSEAVDVAQHLTSSMGQLAHQTANRLAQQPG